MALAAVAAVIVLLVVDLGDPSPGPSPSPTLSPTPSPTPTPAPEVRGSITSTNVLVDASRIVDRTDRPEPRQDSIDQFVDQVQRVLDRHLTDLGRGGGGTLSHLRVDRVQGIAPTLTSDLASVDQWVVNATYTARIGHSGHPQWAEVSARLVRSDGSTTTPTFFFVADDERAPRLAAWAASSAEPAAPTPRPTTSPDTQPSATVTESP